MSIVSFAGGETGDTRELSGSIGALVVDGTIVKTGAYSYKYSPVDTTFTNLGGINSATAFSRSHHYFTKTANPAGTIEILCLVHHNGTSDVAQLFLKVTSGGATSLVLRNGNGGAQIGSDFSVSLDTWYTVEVKTVISATLGILELKVNGAVVATGSNLNTGTNNITLWIQAFYNAAFGTFLGFQYMDDLILGDSAYIGEGGCIARQGKAGAPTYDSFTKNGAATAALCWSDTPFSTGTNCTSIVNGGAQTMLTESFSVTQSGHGNQILGPGAAINACKAAIVGKVAVASSHSIRRRLNGADTDTAKSVTTSDAYYDDGVWTDTLGNLNSAEIGVLHGADVNLLTIEDVWLMVDYGLAQNSVMSVMCDGG